MKLKVKNLKVDQIKPSPENIRLITKKAIKAVKISINKYGYNVPILVDTEYNILAGHTRFEALKLLNAEEVACVIIQEKDPERLNKIRILDNWIGEASDWDMNKLGQELRYILPGMSKEDLEALNLTFPDTSLLERALQNSLGSSTPKVTEGEVQRVQQKLDDKFKERPNINLIHVECPNCHKDIAIRDNG